MEQGPTTRSLRRASGSVRSLVAGWREQATFLAVGMWNTLFGYVVWASLQWLLGEQIHYLVIVLLAWPIAVTNAYICHRYITFHSTEPILTELPRFALVYAGTLVIGLIALPLALEVLPFNIYLTQALLTASVVVASYMAHKYYSFRETEPWTEGGPPQ